MKFLMSRPDYFGVSYTINPWMDGNVGTVNRDLAIQQWTNLKETIEKLGAEVELIEPIDGLPDMVFTANAGFVLREKEFLLTTFKHPERKPEEEYFLHWFWQNDYLIKMQSALFEGEGDCLPDFNGNIWQGYGMRSEPVDSYFFEKPTIYLKLINQNFYHLDTCFAVLDQTTALYYPDAFEHKDIIKYHLSNSIEVTDEEANDFSCNAIVIEKNIVMNKCSSRLKKILNDRGFTVFEVSLSEFLKSGGSAKCLVLNLDC